MLITRSSYNPEDLSFTTHNWHTIVHIAFNGHWKYNKQLIKSMLEILDTIEYIYIKEIFKNESNVH